MTRLSINQMLTLIWRDRPPHSCQIRLERDMYYNYSMTAHSLKYADLSVFLLKFDCKYIPMKFLTTQ